ncbi:MAG: hypothetical protein ABI162_06885 [Luteolibacter sp.]
MTKQEMRALKQLRDKVERMRGRLVVERRRLFYKESFRRFPRSTP